MSSPVTFFVQLIVQLLYSSNKKRALDEEGVVHIGESKRVKSGYEDTISANMPGGLRQDKKLPQSTSQEGLPSNPSMSSSIIGIEH